MLSQAEAERLIAIANTRLGKAGLKLELGGKKLNISVRGMFPPRPDDRRKTWYQTRLSLKLKAIDREAIRQAEQTAREIALELNKGTFDWRKFSDAPIADLSEIASLLAEYERLWWRGKSKDDPAKQTTWKSYCSVIKRFPLDIELSLDSLLDWVVSNEKDSMRRYYCAVATGIAELVGLPTKEIARLNVSGYQIKPVNPRLLPTDAEIVATRDSITDPGWQYIFGLLATYGLRNHEVWWLDYSDFPIVRVRDGTKTNGRPVYPYYLEWAQTWRLDQVCYPQNVVLDKTVGNAKLGLKVTRWSKRVLQRNAYDYRHCFARRLLEFGLTVDVGAKLMGHSITVHQKTYRAWIGDRVYLDAATKAATKADRPQAPLSPDPVSQADT